jgi:glycosyltransferase domain-containing protein
MSKLTIVLTLKDRPEFTRRWMRFMNEQRCPYRILIADGGADKTIESQLRDSSNYPNLDYEYIRYPYDNDIKDYYAKKKDVCERVETEYLLLADNDDFYLLDKISLCIDFLDCNPEYTGCRGSTAEFSLLSKNGDILNEAIGESYRASHYPGKSIDNDNFIERVQSFFNEAFQYDHWFNWYCVYRKAPLVKSMKDLYKYSFSDVILNEILLLLMLLREGKIKVLKQLIYARQLGSSQTSATINKDHNLLELFLINDVFHQFNKFIICERFIINEYERIRILKFFSKFVAVWCCYYSDQYCKKGLRQNFLRLTLSLLKRNKKTFNFLHWFFLGVTHFLFGTRKRYAIKIYGIESYVLSNK